jgi:uncharacterized membrane protein HdeD (DUF308 family)
MLLEKLTRNWWAVALRGLFAMIFGVLAIAWPGPTVAAFVLLFGIYALTDGIFALAAAFAGGTGQPWWTLVLKAIVSVLAAAITFLMPGITALTLLYIIAFWAIVIGLMEISIAIRLRKEIEGEMFLALSGIISVLFGILMITRPGAGALAIAWIIGAYAIGFGVLLIALGFRLKGLRGRVEKMAGA